MADNYLEKKMEEHRRGGSSIHPRTISPLGTPKGSVCLALSFRRIFITGVDANPEAGAAVVKAFGNAGCDVAFVYTDLNAGRRLAQNTSTRHYPTDTKAALEHFVMTKGEPDMTVEIDGEGATMRTAEGDYRLSGTSEEIADTMLTLSLASAGALRARLIH
ncbi:MAG: hypothetical protein HDS65_01870 [Bacteroidales bacterium]|nr:hypothetical protein [Bacteroidales bacterium]